MADLADTWKRLSEQKRVWEEKWFSLTPWIIALDGAILGVGTSHMFDLQKEPWRFKCLSAVGMGIIGVSFVYGILFRKADIDLEFSKANEIGKKYLKDLDEARAVHSELPPESVESAKQWAEAVKNVDAAAERLQGHGNKALYSFVVGIIVCGVSNLTIVFRPELQAWHNRRQTQQAPEPAFLLTIPDVSTTTVPMTPVNPTQPPHRKGRKEKRSTPGQTPS